MPRLATAQVIEEARLPEITTSTQIDLSHKKLARLRANLKAIRHELSNRLLFNMEACRKTVNTTMDAIGEINAAFNSKNE